MKKTLLSIRRLITILFILAFVFFSFVLILRAAYPLRYYEHIEKYSDKYNLDKFFVMAVIKAESNYIHDAHSGYAGGLMQITDETGKWICKQLKTDFDRKDIDNPEKNIEMGCYYLNYLYKHYNGNTELALAAYNAGMGNVDSWLKNPDFSPDGKNLSHIPYSETREYVEKIKKYEEIYKKLYRFEIS